MTQPPYLCKIVFHFLTEGKHSEYVYSVAKNYLDTLIYHFQMGLTK